MVLTTIVGRLGDGMPLVASLVTDEQPGKYTQYHNQAKALFKKLSAECAPKCTIETDEGVCFLTLCDKTYSKNLAFSYLEDLANEFRLTYGNRVQRVNRPYPFMEFDAYIQRTRKTFMDSRARIKLSTLNTELQDVQRIMMDNIDDVLKRGTALSELEGKAQGLSLLSHKYKKEARYLNLRSTFAKFAAAFIVLLVLGAFIWLR